MAAFDVFASILANAPFAFILFTLVHFSVQRARWKRRRRLGIKNPGFCPSFSTMGPPLETFAALYRPTVQHVIEIRRDEDADEDDNGDPESPAAQLHRQLRRIRRGEQIDTLVLRL
jgi:hypothetical protein